MAGGGYLVGGPADEDVDDVADAPRLLHPGDARQDLLRHDGRIGRRLELLQAPVAGAAAVGLVALPEVLDERAMAAPRARRVVLHVAHQRPRALAPFAVRL